MSLNRHGLETSKRYHHDGRRVRRVHIVYFDAGSGHRSAAKALSEAIRIGQWPWAVELINLDDLLESVDLVQKATGRRGPEWYNWTLRRGWTSAPARVMPAVRGYLWAMRVYHVRILREHWRKTMPDLVISVLPHYNRALFNSVREELPRTPMVTILTDLGDCPPHFWFEQQDQHFICGSELAVRQAQSLGIPKNRLWPVSGMIVHPSFYQENKSARRLDRSSLGLSRNIPVALIMFGGHGSAEMLAIVNRIIAARTRVQLVLMCGRNESLFRRLCGITTPFPKHVQGFTTEVDRFMRLSDVFIGKPGPGSVSEAIAAGLPVIVEHNSRTMLQERHTARWIVETGTGVALPSFDGITTALDRMLEPHAYSQYQSRVLRLHNRAVFEIPEILDGIMRLSTAQGTTRGSMADCAIL